MARMDSGIGGLPAGAIDNEDAFAGGGIVAFAEGDPVKSKPPTYSLTDDQKAYLAETDRIVGLPPGTSYRQIEVESAFNPRAVSPANAKGLAQIYPPTLPGASRLVGRKLDPFNPTDSLEAHRALMKENMERFKDPVKALRAYNGGWTESTWNNTDENRKYVPKILGFLTGSGNANAAEVPRTVAAAPSPSAKTGIANTTPDTDQQVNPYTIGATAAAAGAGAAALPPVRTGIASVPNVPAGVPPAGVPPAGVPPAGTPSLLSRGLGALRGIAASPYTTGAGLMLHSSELGAGSDIVPKKPAGRPPTPREIDELLESGKISDVEAREMLKRLPAAPAVKPPVDDTSQVNRGMGSSDRNPDGTKYEPPGFSPRAPVDAETAFMNDIRDQIMTGLRDKTPPETLEAYTARHEAIDKKLGVDPGATKKFFEDQAKGFTEQATQARQDRNVNLWMSAANGFFAMAGGMSPYAMKNFADGLGVGTKQATAALNDYRNIDREIAKNQRDMSKLQLQTNMGHAEKYAAREDKFLERQAALEAKKQATLMSLYGQLATQANTKATQANTSALKEISMAETKRYNEAREEAKKIDQGIKRAEAWDKHVLANPAIGSLQNKITKETDPRQKAVLQSQLRVIEQKWAEAQGAAPGGATSTPAGWSAPQIVKP